MAQRTFRQKQIDNARRVIESRIERGQPITVRKGSATEEALNQIQQEESQRRATRQPTQTEISLGMSLANGRNLTPEEVIRQQSINEVRINPRGNDIQNIVTATQPPTRIQELRFKAQTGRITQSERGELIDLESRLPFIETGSFLKQLATSPIETTQNIIRGGREVGRKIITSEGFEVTDPRTLAPETIIGRISGEVALALAGGEIPRISELARARLSSKFVPVLKTSSGNRFIEILDSNTGRITRINLEERAVTDIGISLNKQLGFAGTTTDTISAQRSFFNILTGELEVNKPINFKRQLTPRGKALLNKFDESGVESLSLSELTELDQAVKEAGAKGILERSFFASPNTNLRTSRLGLDDRASLLDIISGDVSFRRGRPQALLFKDVKVADIPNDLRNLLERGIAGDNAAFADFQRLFLQRQLTPSGQFQPIGFLGREPELTLAPNEIIRKVDTGAVTIISGRRVPIFFTEVIEASDETKLLLKKLRNNELTNAEFLKLKRNLKAETGFDYSSVPISDKRYLNPLSVETPIASVLSSLSKFVKSKPILLSPKISSSKSASSRAISILSSGSSNAPTSSSLGIISNPSSSNVFSSMDISSKTTSSLSSGVTSGRKAGSINKVSTPRTKLNRLKKLSNKMVLQKLWQTQVKQKGKYTNIGNPTNKARALYSGADYVDNTLDSTFRVKQINKKGNLPLEKYLPDPRIFRNYQIRQGKKIPLKDTWIEKRNRRLSTRGEVFDIQRAKREAPKKTIRTKNMNFLK